MPNPIEAGCLKDLAGIRHGFFTRNGGVSEGIYARLNCGLGSADRREAVPRTARASPATWALRASTSSRCTRCTARRRTSSTARSRASNCRAPTPWSRQARPGGRRARRRLRTRALRRRRGPCRRRRPRRVARGGGGRGGGRGRGDDRPRRRARAHPRRGRALHRPEVYEVGPEFEAELVARDPASALLLAGKARGASPLRPARLRRAPSRRARARRGRALRAVHLSRRSLFFSYRRSCARGEPDYGRQISAIVVA